MKEVNQSIHILFPVYNERLRLANGIERTVAYLRKHVRLPYHLTILDNGSEDETPEIGKALAVKYPEVAYIRVDERGVGAAFRKGIAINNDSLVGYMDIDLSTDIRHLKQVITLFERRPKLQYINGTRFSRQSDTSGRRWYRKLTSWGLVLLLKVFFKMRATDAICGFTFIRKETAEALVASASKDNGWFYMIELLLRAEKSGVAIYDMPVVWQEDYNTTVKISKTMINYIIRMCRLKKLFREEERKRRLRGKASRNIRMKRQGY